MLDTIKIIFCVWGIPAIIAMYIGYIQSYIKNRLIIPTLLCIGLVYCEYRLKTAPYGEVGEGLDRLGHLLYFSLLELYLLLFLLVCIISTLKSLGKLFHSAEIDKNAKDKFENELSDNEKALLNQDYEIYYFKKTKNGEVLGCLVINKKFDKTCEIKIVDVDKEKILKKQRKAKLIIKKIKELGYKEVIADKKNYDYLKKVLNHYEIKSIESEKDYMLEL